ncbi:hypothetical protein H6G33_35245 [Calothrix sp. FACHB-1219]|uniref:hypothetical protein n=1 Tax=unclassified Calothrix TaxID=2619626 RepID=UPI001687FCFD|nr:MULTISPECIES: hypothetical protein [unclassified Calothrix]MBD2207590.1 hypothetical protein [Calothrix sp. FACHB-168]MBD2222191.1 hypothetical protein [Calothrix sp. FACHB-1219]
MIFSIGKIARCMLGDSYGKLKRSRFCYLVLRNWYHRCDGVIGLVMLESDRLYSKAWLVSAIAFTVRLG